VEDHCFVDLIERFWKFLKRKVPRDGWAWAFAERHDVRGRDHRVVAGRPRDALCDSVLRSWYHVCVSSAKVVSVCGLAKERAQYARRRRW